ncbi:MAG: MBL fold metallo-hydrolase [Pseudomonadota bacterium]|nr:MBL fold metallo-hydrolase [Pseudomonadota bacterium]
MILKQMQVSQMAVFAYLVGDEETGEALVIDPAADTARIVSAAADNGLTIKYIVNTHGHVDHISGNRDMKERTGAQIIVHEADADMLVSTPALYLRMFGAKPSPPADILVREGDAIAVGRVAFQVIATPGHTPGSMCLYGEGLVFTGDTLFVGAIGRTDLPGSSWNAMARSLKEKLAVLPDDTKVLPGHNYGSAPTSTIGYEKRHNPYLRF